MRYLVLLILVACSLAGSARAQSENQPGQEKKAAKGAAAESAISADQNAVDHSEYKIGPQDFIRIDVWKEDQLTRTVPVRPDGKITLPLLNDVQAAGLTPMELAKVIREGLKKYINEPQVTVSVTEINSRRVYVTGEVTRPGTLPLLPNMTVLQALTSSGGFTQFAKIKSIYVLRTTDGKQERLPFNYKEVVNGQKPDQNIQLQPGDVIVVP